MHLGRQPRTILQNTSTRLLTGRLYAAKNITPWCRSSVQSFSCRAASMASASSPKKRIAVLYQDIEPPVINGLKKPKKPGGYKDSCADIAYCLSLSPTVETITPGSSDDGNPPRPEDDAAWCFPDNEDGILAALEKGASHLWANTILFASHPLQTSYRIGEYADRVKLIGQPPCLVELFDDKELVNDMLRAAGNFTMPRSWSVRERPDIGEHLAGLDLPFPVVAKPIRGRGSHGVKRCDSLEELTGHCRELLGESPKIMLEEFLSGEEATVTVMPPTTTTTTTQGGMESSYWALPVVKRFNHRDGIAPYNGVVAVTANSEAVVSPTDPAYAQVAEECERAAKLLGATAPIRIDVRRARDDEPGCKFTLFDVNMKPNMTGPGRPGRDDQACLSLMAAEASGWDYTKLLEETLKTAATLKDVRMKRPQ